ncbi:hypothetical protein HF1_11660 [Mycoplasma haemofelis str. Langford 1]|uniref:Uncharacterized protein n=1 Tax=Mycoplasma haemofelis (strain Langford 1) TaxID=941640 RepID=E8ZJ53_MYCHL|nr:hypothetical protein [Mycoplasma haemofelis]CBY93174.1 hypothetical protein HF1_11660 [Mycoplasma haemofelis str. Langford 1]
MDLIKPLIALGSGGTLATGAYLTKDHWMPSNEKEFKSISDALKGRTLISSLKDDTLTKQWEAEFESDKDAIKKLLGDSALEKQQVGKKLSEWCVSKMSLDVNKNPEVFKNVENYCLIRSVASQLQRNKKTLLDVKSEDGWVTTYEQRKKKTTNRSNIGLEGEWNKPPEQQQDLNAIKAWCSSNSGGDFLASQEGDNSLYTKVLKWCTKDGATEN